MPYSRLLLRGSVKPPYPLILDRSHPFYSGLQNMYVFDGSVRNVAKAAVQAPTITGSPTYAAAHRGRYMAMPLGSWIDIPVSEDWSGHYSLMFIARVNDLPGSYDALFNKCAALSNAIQIFFGRAGTANHYAVYHTGGSGVSLANNDLSGDLGIWRVFVLTWDGATVRLYRSGRPMFSVAFTTSPSTGTEVLRLGSGNTSTYDGDTDFAMFARWNRALPNVVVQQLLENPYQMFRPHVRTIFVPAVVGGVSGLSISVNDPITTAESLGTPFYHITSSVIDTLTAAESVVMQLPINVNAVDVLTVAEYVNQVISEAGTLGISVSDTVSIAEYVLAQIQLNISLSDTITVNDFIGMLVDAIHITCNVSDAITIAESATLRMVLQASLVDTVTVNEYVSAIVSGVLGTMSYSDAVTIAESVSVSIVTVGLLWIAQQAAGGTWAGQQAAGGSWIRQQDS